MMQDKHDSNVSACASEQHWCDPYLLPKTFPITFSYSLLIPPPHTITTSFHCPAWQPANKSAVIFSAVRASTAMLASTATAKVQANLAMHLQGEFATRVPSVYIRTRGLPRNKLALDQTTRLNISHPALQLMINSCNGATT